MDPSPAGHLVSCHLFGDGEIIRPGARASGYVDTKMTTMTTDRPTHTLITNVSMSNDDYLSVSEFLRPFDTEPAVGAPSLMLLLLLLLVPLLREQQVTKHALSWW